MRDDKNPAGDGESSGVFVSSEIDPITGAYLLTVSTGTDHARPLTPAEATAYGLAVLAACARATYTAAILEQMTSKVGVPLPEVAALVKDLREDLPPLDDAATAPVQLQPGVSATTRKPFLTVHLDGRPIGQWDIPVARDHALHVLEGIETVNLDGAYWRLLVSLVGVGDNRARHVVNDLAEFR